MFDSSSSGLSCLSFSGLSCHFHLFAAVKIFLLIRRGSAADHLPSWEGQ